MPDVVIQAGHEGGVRNSGSTGSAPTFGASGVGVPERELTPVVADQVTTMLRAHGITVVRENAFYDQVYSADLSIALHFDGNATACASGASVGYPSGSPPGSNKPYAQTWKDVYAAVWPYKWMPDNFTGNLSGYYGYSWVNTTLGEFLIEFGEISCQAQYDWLKPRVDNGYLAALVAHAVGVMLDVDIRHPDTPPPDPEPEEPMITIASHGAKVTSVVKRTQEAVNTWMRLFPSNKPPGWQDLTISGTYDTATHEAVELYQDKAMGLELPGGLDGLTMGALVARFNPSPGRIDEIVGDVNEHNHDADYSTIGHGHVNKSNKGHTHAVPETEGDK